MRLVILTPHKNITLTNCNAYLDDLIVYTTTWDEQIKILKQAFTRLSEASLALNLAKCNFGKATVTYLYQGQVRPVEARVSAIADCPVRSRSPESPFTVS